MDITCTMNGKFEGYSSMRIMLSIYMCVNIAECLRT